jgi:hypothetical protein
LCQPNKQSIVIVVPLIYMEQNKMGSYIYVALFLLVVILIPLFVLLFDFLIYAFFNIKILDSVKKELEALGIFK